MTPFDRRGVDTITSSDIRIRSTIEGRNPVAMRDRIEKARSTTIGKDRLRSESVQDDKADPLPSKAFSHAKDCYHWTLACQNHGYGAAAAGMDLGLSTFVHSIVMIVVSAFVQRMERLKCMTRWLRIKTFS